MGSPFWRAAASRSSRAARCPVTQTIRKRATSKRRCNGVLFASLYAPNGNPQPGPKFTYKLAWLDRLVAHAAELLGARTCRSCSPATSTSCRRITISIRQNPTPRMRSFSRKAARGFSASSLRAGSTRSARSIPTRRCITFWDYMRNRWPRDAGLRLDHLLLSPQAAQRLVAAGVDRDVRGRDGASDHAPAWIELRERAAAMKNARPQMARPQIARPRAKPSSGRRPLLVIDGDLFAHRSYHALPKTILRKGKRPAGAILGFANVLLRLYRDEQPRAVLVAWDTLEAPTYRHEEFADYQSGREFDDDLVEQLDVIPDFVAACGFANAKRAGYEADDFSGRCGRRRGKARRHCAGRERRSRYVSARLGEDDDPLSGSRRRDGADRSCRSSRALRRRPEAGAGFHRAARRSVRQAAGRARRRRTGRGKPAAPIREPCGDPESRPLCQAGRRSAAVPFDRHHGPQGATAALVGSNADLGESRQAGAASGSSSSLQQDWRSLPRVRPQPSAGANRAPRTKLRLECGGRCHPAGSGRSRHPTARRARLPTPA